MTPDEYAETIDHYQLLRRIGRGSMGVVYLARDMRQDREVALKILRPDMRADDALRARFAREARAAAALRHRNIVAVLDFSNTGEWPYIVMEFLRGENLAVRLAAGEPFSTDAKLDIAIQLCEGLQYAHDQGVVHRDVKPANIWLLPDGGVKLLDFGIAKLAGSTFTEQGSLVGSAAYMAPEQLSGAAVDRRADIFSAGVVLYKLIAGRRPFDGENVTGVITKVLYEEPPPLRGAPDLSHAVIAAIETALKKDPDARYAEASDFGTELRLARYAAPQRRLPPPVLASVEAPPVSVVAAPAATPEPVGPPTPVAPRNRKAAVAAAALAMAGVIGLSFWARPGGRTPTESPVSTPVEPAPASAPASIPDLQRAPSPAPDVDSGSRAGSANAPEPVSVGEYRAAPRATPDRDDRSVGGRTAISGARVSQSRDGPRPARRLDGGRPAALAGRDPLGVQRYTVGRTRPGRRGC